MSAVRRDKFSDADRLILEAATRAGYLSRGELQQVIEHVAQAGFDPDAREGWRPHCRLKLTRTYYQV